MHRLTEYRSIAEHEIAPSILMSSYYQKGAEYPKGFRLEERTVYAYELEYYLFSEGAMVIEGTEYPIEAGDIVFRRPGQLVRGIMPYTCYVICFDMLGTTGRMRANYGFGTERDLQPYYTNRVLDPIPSVVKSLYPDRYRSIFEFIFREYVAMKPGSELAIRAGLTQLLHRLYMDSNNFREGGVITAGPYGKLLSKAVGLMRERIASKIDLKSLAAYVGMSPGYFQRIFTKAFNVSPCGYLTGIRMEKAREMLLKTDCKISEIARQCGYENIAYFGCSFKKHFQVSPGEFRNRHRYI